MSKFREYFIGDIIKKTDDVFEHARAIMLLRFTFVFLIVFTLPIVTDVLLDYNKALFIHGSAFVTLIAAPFIIKRQQNLDKSINFIFTICVIVSQFSFMVLNPNKIDPIGMCWALFFLVLSALMQVGKARILFCCFLLWLPLCYVLLNISLNGILTIECITQKGIENPPLFLLFIPVILAIYAVWTHTTTIQKARVTITTQKQIIDQKNKDMLDSIHYAKRIQTSLLPTEKYIVRVLKENARKN